jgi:DNA-binding CsgD family transcriptional regulator
MAGNGNKVILVVPQQVIDRCLEKIGADAGGNEVVGLVSELPVGGDVHIHRNEPVRPDESELSDREKEILVCVAKGMLNKQIADRFSLSIYTVITHRKNITRKTGIKTVAGLTVYAILNGLIDIGSIEG